MPRHAPAVRRGKRGKDPRTGKAQVLLDEGMREDVVALIRLKVGKNPTDAVRTALRLTSEIAGACEQGASLNLCRPSAAPERLRVLAGRAVL